MASMKSIFLPGSLALPVLASLSMTPGAQDAVCPSCGDTGRAPCEQHRASDLALEANAIRCTFYRGCASCEGTGNVDCAECASPGVTDRELGDLVTRFLEYDEVAGRPVLAAASANFNVVWEHAPMRAERKKRSAHELLHLYLDRLEETRAEYLTVFRLEGEDLIARSEVFVWEEKADHELAGEAFCGYTSPDPTFRRGLEAITSIWVDGRRIGDDAELHRMVVHLSVHGMMNVQKPAAWTGELRMGWADAGLAHWFEDRMLGSVGGYCLWPEERPTALKKGDWRPAVRKLVTRETELDFVSFLSLDTKDLSPEQHALGFSLIDYLVNRDPVLLDRLLRRLRSRTPPRDAFKEVYDESLDQLEASWRAWVETSYPKR